jgi:hypothetical protein
MILYQSLIIALLVLSIHYTMLEGEIFAALGRWFENNLPAKIHPAVFECNVCMSFWYGHAIYFILWGLSWYSFVVVICAMGFNIIINKWTPEKD